jgi:hypothetical protein
MSHGVLIALFAFGALFEIVGLAATAKDITVIKGGSTVEIEVPNRRQALRGPAVIVLGILTGLAGNILWLICP